MTKTRDKLIEVARQLFARIGVENTTMNDIAMASKKGRRTLYTHFKNKTEIYVAVIESELDILYKSLETITEKDLPADEMLVEFILTRLESVKNVVYRNGTLRANFFRDAWRVENVRKSFDQKEITIIRNLLIEGIGQGVFDVSDPDSMAVVLHHALKGLEVPYIRGTMPGFSSSDRSQINNITNFLFFGIKKNKES
jgi:AcrR family transcriptional regulator